MKEELEAFSEVAKSMATTAKKMSKAFANVSRVIQSVHISVCDHKIDNQKVTFLAESGELVLAINRDSGNLIFNYPKSVISYDQMIQYCLENDLEESRRILQLREI